MKRKHITLFVLLAAGSILMTGCAEYSGADSASQETLTAESSSLSDSAIEGNSADAEQNAEEESAGQDMADKTAGAVLEQSELPFPLGQEVNAPKAFTGTVYLESVINADEVYHFPQTNHITFEPGARSGWHTHGGIIILVTGGGGYYQEEGKPAQIIRKGDAALCPSGVKHWHGGSADSSFAHIAVNTNPELTGLECFDRTSDEEYRQLTSENESK